MSEQPDDGGDLQYDEAHGARDPGAAVRPRSGRPPHLPPPPPPELDGDYSYDLAHDVPRG